MSELPDFRHQNVAHIQIPDEIAPTGIDPVDQRMGGLRRGGSYLIVGTPGPAKMVAGFQFLDAGLARGEPCALLTNGDDEGTLGVARAWGFEFEGAWRDGSLHILGFKDDFELRALRTVEPEEVLEELDQLVGRDVARIAIDPGSMFLTGGAKSLLGSSYLKWARNHPATVCSTFSVDGAAGSLPSSADWLVHATTGRVVIEWRKEELYQIRLVKAVPDAGDREETISVQLKPGVGLVAPEALPARRGRDRPGVDEGRLLLISLGGVHAEDIETWARDSFTADVVSEPFEAVAKVQSDASFGGILIHAPRARVREAVKACKALRPLTRAAIVFASDDAIRSTDRINVLEAGADDCLSGTIDFRELDLRIRQAIAAGSKPTRSADDREEPNGESTGMRLEGGSVARGLFVDELARRSTDPVLKFFCVLDVSSGALDLAQLQEVLTDQVRADEGDLVSAAAGRCAVLLQGAREGQLGPFLGRLRARIEERAGKNGDPGLSVDVLSHPSDADRIRKLLRTDGGSVD
jgi:KaiC/GvpD/RAD55 family RecA-like ATPase